MKTKESIEIPLGAKDSELKGWEYTIPEGMEAIIENGKIIVREKESEDERVRKHLVKHFQNKTKEDWNGMPVKDILAWLEKQGKEKTTWVKEDEIGFIDAMWAIDQARTIAKDENDLGNLWYAEKWLKSLKERHAWKPSDEQMTSLERSCT